MDGRIRQLTVESVPRYVKVEIKVAAVIQTPFVCNMQWCTCQNGEQVTEGKPVGVTSSSHHPLPKPHQLSPVMHAQVRVIKARLQLCLGSGCTHFPAKQEKMYLAIFNVHVKEALSF